MLESQYTVLSIFIKGMYAWKIYVKFHNVNLIFPLTLIYWRCVPKEKKIYHNM